MFWTHRHKNHLCFGHTDTKILYVSDTQTQKSFMIWTHRHKKPLCFGHTDTKIIYTFMSESIQTNPYYYKD